MISKFVILSVVHHDGHQRYFGAVDVICNPMKIVSE